MIALLVALLAACAEERPQPCQLGHEKTLGVADGQSFDDVVLVGAGDRLVAVTSDRGGLRVRAAELDGTPRGEAQRVADRCDAGVAARARAAGGIVLGCSRRTSDHRPGGVELIELDASLRPRRSRTFGTVGRDSFGVDVIEDGPRMLVAWHDGTPGAYRTWIAELASDEESPVPRLLSSERVAGGAPALIRTRERGGRVLMAWSETWFDESARPSGQVVVGDGRGAPRKIADTAYQEPWPVLAEDATGVLVGFRDERPRETHAGFYIQRLDRNLQPRGRPVRVGRANGLGRPWLLACPRALVAVAPRSYGRWEGLVGVHRLGPDLARIGDERQIYEAGVDFSHAGPACTREGLVVLASERAMAATPTAHLRAMDVTCPESP